MEKNDLKQIRNIVKEEIKEEVEGLAQIVAKGFEQVDKRFDNIEIRLSNLEDEVRQMRAEIKQIWNKLEEIEQKVEKISKIAKEDMDAIASDILNLRQRIEFLENQVKKMQTA